MSYRVSNPVHVALVVDGEAVVVDVGHGVTELPQDIGDLLVAMDLAVEVTPDDTAAVDPPRPAAPARSKSKNTPTSEA